MIKLQTRSFSIHADDNSEYCADVCKHLSTEFGQCLLFLQELPWDKKAENYPRCSLCKKFTSPTRSNRGQ